MKDGVGVNGTTKDIVENPKGFKWLKVDLLNLAETYSENDVSLVYNYPTYISKIGLKPADALFLEKTLIHDSQFNSLQEKIIKTQKRLKNYIKL